MIRIVLSFLCCLLVAGCTKASNPRTGAADLPPELFAKSEPGFADAELTARSVESSGDGSTIILAAARAGEVDVAFRLVLPPKWDAWKPEGFPGTLYRGTVRLESIGVQTESFVRALAKAYGQPVDGYEFADVTLTAITLEGDPKTVRTLPVKLKAFYESQTEGEYAEFFLNLDLPRRIVQFHEKDQDYRRAIVRFLSKKRANQGVQ
jgi:hypothetical protein